MESLPKVSVLIPLYNAERFISETIDSVLNQTYENIEIIIVDDGSTDNSYRIAEEYQNKYSNIIVTRQANKGPGAARNKAFSLSSGEFIQYLDADDLLAPNKIELQSKILLKEKKAFVFGQVAEFKTNIQSSRFMSFPFFHSYQNIEPFFVDYWGYSGMLATHSFMASKDSIIAAGPWNEKWILNEDGEFISRLICQCEKIVFLEKSISYYRKDNSMSLNSHRSEKHFTSQLESYDSYLNIIEQKFPNNRQLREAMAKRYSRLIANMYPNYDKLIKIAQIKLYSLGFSKPLPNGSQKFNLLSNMLGFYNTLFLQHLFKKITFQKIL